MKMGEKIVQTAGRDRSNHNPCHHVCRLAEGLGYLPSCKGCMEGRGGGQVMRRMISVLAAVLLALGLTACGNSEGQATNGAAQTPQAESPQETEIANSTEETTEQTEADVSASNISEVAPEETGSENGDGGVLVVYFSATGTTKDVAERLQTSRERTPMRSRPHRSIRMQILIGVILIVAPPRSRMIHLRDLRLEAMRSHLMDIQRSI